MTREEERQLAEQRRDVGDQFRAVARRASGRPMAIVVGATGDIGREFVNLLAASRYFVVAIARNNERLMALKQDVCGSSNERYRWFGYVAADVSEPLISAEIANVAAHVSARIELLVLTAGDCLPDNDEKAGFANELASIDYHLKANLMSRVNPYMALHGRFLVTASTPVVVIGSVAGEWPANDARLVNEVGYAASMRAVGVYCRAVQAASVGRSRLVYAPLPLMTGTIHQRLVAAGLVPTDFRPPTPREEVLKIVNNLVAANMLTLDLL